MTTVEDSAHITGTARRLSGAAATFLVFVVVGPLVGGGTIFLALIALTRCRPTSPTISAAPSSIPA